MYIYIYICEDLTTEMCLLRFMSLILAGHTQVETQ